MKKNETFGINPFTHWTSELAGGKITAAAVLLLNTPEIQTKSPTSCEIYFNKEPPPQKENSYLIRENGRSRPPVDGLAGVSVSSVTTATGAVDEQPRLVAVCVLVTAAVVFGAEVWSWKV